jgi:hypothetical protein
LRLAQLLEEARWFWVAFGAVIDLQSQQVDLAIAREDV